MSQITISNIDDRILQGLKQIAWQSGLPFDESLRRLLSDTVSAKNSVVMERSRRGVIAVLPPATD